METGEEKEIYRIPDSHRVQMRLSPDGRRLAGIHWKRLLGVNMLFTLGPDGGEPRELLAIKEPEQLAYPGFAWSVDGRYLLFAVRRGQQTELWRIPAEGGQPQNLGIRMEGIHTLSVHPDGHRIELTSEDAAPAVRADRGALGRALWNLLDNAVKYSPACPTVWVDLAREGERVAIRVRDQGLGIPAEEQKEIFQKCASSPSSRSLRGWLGSGWQHWSGPAQPPAPKWPSGGLGQARTFMRAGPHPTGGIFPTTTRGPAILRSTTLPLGRAGVSMSRKAAGKPTKKLSILWLRQMASRSPTAGAATTTFMTCAWLGWMVPCAFSRHWARPGPRRWISPRTGVTLRMTSRRGKPLNSAIFSRWRLKPGGKRPWFSTLRTMR